MSDILSLSKARKAKARSGKEAQAERNRLLHGRTKAEKQLAKAKKALAERRIEGHRIDPPPAVTPLKSRKPNA